MQRIQRHLLVFVGLQLIVLAAFHRVPALPLWSQPDVSILHDAFHLSQDPGVLIRHIGAVFSQFVLQLFFLIEYRCFGLDMSSYLTVNLLLHGANSFLLYLLVNLLFHRAGIAVPAAALFALAVGNYGKVLLTISGQEPLLLALLYLACLYTLIRADFKHDGRLTSPWFLLGLGLFGLAGLARPTLFSLLFCLLAYKFFFYRERGSRRILAPSVLILVVVGVLFAVFRELWGFKDPPIRFSEERSLLVSGWLTLKTVFRYLNLMVFPMQVSELLQSSHPAVQLVYDWRLPIRLSVSLLIISFSFFGFLFGSKPLRFFISWTYITVLPFALALTKGEWLNLQFLYLTSAGFCVILASGAIGCQGLLEAHRFKRLFPWMAPALLVVMTLALNSELRDRAHARADSPGVLEIRAVLESEIGDICSPPERR